MDSMPYFNLLPNIKDELIQEYQASNQNSHETNESPNATSENE
jgi:hypothetical protein